MLLGDTLELRHGPLREALAAARPVLEAVGAALGDAEVVLVAGNHDHRLLAPWLEARGRRPPPPLGLEEHAGPGRRPPAARDRGWLAPRAPSRRLPGLWLAATSTRRTATTSTATRPSRARAPRRGRARPRPRRPPRRHLAPRRLRASSSPRSTRCSTPSPRARPTDAAPAHVERLDARVAGAHRRRPPPLRRTLLAGAFPLGVGALNRLGLGPVQADLSGAELRRAGVRAMGQVVAAPAHRRPPRDLRPHPPRRPASGDDAADWALPAAGLVNSGCWVHEASLDARRRRRSPYWPGRRRGDRRRRPAAPVRLLATCRPRRSDRAARRRRQPRREADGEALDAVADLEVEHALGAHRVGDDLVGARVLDRDRRPFTRDLAVAVEDGPHAAGDVRAAHAPGHVRGRHDDPRLRVVLGPHRGERVALDPEQLLDRALGLLVAALAEVESCSREAWLKR